MNLNFKKTPNTKLYKPISFIILFLSFSNFLFSYAIEYSGFGGKPAFPREDNPRTESIFVHTVNPGETIEEGVRVINNTNEIKTFLVYAADYTKSTDGGFACKQYSHNKTGVGSWVILEKEEITIDPMSEETIPFEIIIPEDVEVGEHNGCIIVQEKKPQSESAGISISVRTGLRIAITIPGEIIRKLDLSNILVKRKGLEKLTLNLSVKNSGNVSVDTDVRVKVTNLLGKEIITFGGKYPIFRNDEATYNYDLKSPIFGSIYKAKGIATYDGNAGTFIGKADYTNPITIETRPIYFLVFPTLKGLAIITVSILFIFFMLIKMIIRRKRKKWIMSNWVQYRVKKDDDINSLSKKYDINWKILAKTNKLKAPYIIRSSDILKVPPKKLGDKKTIGKQIKGDIENKKINNAVKPKNKTVEKNKAMPKTRTETKPKRATKPKTVVKKEPPIKPQVDEVNSIV